MPKYIEPKSLAEVFTCPFCDVTAKHHWLAIDRAVTTNSMDDTCSRYCLQNPINAFVDICSNNEVKEWAFAECSNCGHLSLWYRSKMVFPEATNVEEPNKYMPEPIIHLYREADSVFPKSPRSSAALLRLALQELTNELLGDNAKASLYDNIKEIAKQEYASPSLIKALDIIRFNGNESVHPGEINLNEDEDEARFLFVLLNSICEVFFEHPQRLEESYMRIPESKRIPLSSDDGSSVA